MSTTWIAFIAAMALVIVIAFPCNADSLIVRDGNIVLIHPLTSGGKDSDPLMAPDGRTGYFVRTIPDPEASKQWDGEATQILSIKIPDGQTRVLLNSAGAIKPEENLRGFANLLLSPNGRTLLFISAAWATSGAVHALDLTTGAVSYICPGNEILLVPNGEYRGYLVVEKHKYMVGGGSHDYYWLVTPEGKELGMFGETRQQVEMKFQYK
jgi:hypothetical protein